MWVTRVYFVSILDRLRNKFKCNNLVMISEKWLCFHSRNNLKRKYKTAKELENSIMASYIFIFKLLKWIGRILIGMLCMTFPSGIGY